MAVNHEAPKDPGVPLCEKMSKMYSKYFPTDRGTFGIRFSLLGLIVSLFALQLLFLYIICCERDGIYVHAFYVLIGSVHFGLYIGLKTGKLRLVTPWLIWKIVETIFTICVIIIGAMKRRYYSAANIILASFLVAANILMMFCLYKHQVETSEVKEFQEEKESNKATLDV